MPQPGPEPAPRPSGLNAILAVNFVGTLGFSIVLPFLVFLVTRWGGNALVYGLMGATYSAFQLVGAPILGRWSDRVGRRRILLLSQLGTFVSWGVFVVAFYLPQTTIAEFDSALFGTFTLSLPLVVLFLARAADGITGGNVSVANAYLADITHEDERNVNFGRLAVATNLGFVVGPALAGLLAGTSIGELAPVLAALGISAVASVIILFGLPESPRPCEIAGDPGQSTLRRTYGVDNKDCFEYAGERDFRTRDLFILPGVTRLLVMYFLVLLGFNFFYVSFPMQAVEGLQWTVRETGAFFAILGLLMALVQGPVLRQAAARWTETRLILSGSVVLAASFAFFASSSTLMVYAGAASLALGNGIMWPSLMAVLSKSVDSRYQGAVQGLAGSLGAAASILGLITGGLLFSAFGPATFLLATLAVGVAGVMAVQRPESQSSDPSARSANR